MQSALHITTKVLRGNRVEVQLPLGSEGQEVDVFIVLPIAAGNRAEVPRDGQHKLAQLAQMAADPEIQAELTAIESEFAIAQLDGLGTQ
jgi:mannitol/fructose-specific phosphotransferase system IIA component (Ntr-type)